MWGGTANKLWGVGGGGANTEVMGGVWGGGHTEVMGGVWGGGADTEVMGGCVGWHINSKANLSHPVIDTRMMSDVKRPRQRLEPGGEPMDPGSVVQCLTPRPRPSDLWSSVLPLGHDLVICGPVSYP